MYRKLVALVAVLLLGALLFPTAAGAKNNKVDVCHLTGNGSYHLISVSEKAVLKHLDNHGDGLPGRPVPGVGGYVFGADCELELIFVCWDSTNSDGLDLRQYQPPADTSRNVTFRSSKDGTCTGAILAGGYAMVLVENVAEASAKCEALGLIAVQDGSAQGWLRGTALNYPDAPADSFLCSWNGSFPF